MKFREILLLRSPRMPPASCLPATADKDATPLSDMYNSLLLSHRTHRMFSNLLRLSWKGMKELDSDFQAMSKDQLLSTRKRKRNVFILAYNRALIV